MTGKFRRHLETGAQSTNITDARSPFGSSAVDDTYGAEDRSYDFLKDSLLHPYLSSKPQTFKKGAGKPGMSMKDMLTYIASKGAAPTGITLNSAFNEGVYK